MTTITEAGHNLAGIQQALLDMREILDRELSDEIAEIDMVKSRVADLLIGLNTAHQERAHRIRAHIAAIDALIGSDEAEERKAA